ncbi:fructose-bisphosphate aldolase class I [Pelagibacteraceae bacterium]|nr:fructose-bisphosphate aldolase class I [Pelagibacteraceae bacterium]
MKIEKIAIQMLASGKGILAADESTGTMTKRLDSVNVSSTEKNRLGFRETLFTSNKVGSYVSGVILYDETIKQKCSNGDTIPELLNKQNILPGIKVDAGTKPLDGSPNELYTDGLTGLSERLKEYYNLGARFTKWRAVFKISKEYPSQNAISINAKSLAKYAALVQEANMVPIVEPEVLMDGDHDINRCFEVTSAVLKECFQELKNEKVKIEGIVLKPNMILNGADSRLKNEPGIVASKTLECLKNNIPKEVPGIAFLSGGQSEVDATTNLNEINKINDTNLIFTFSYGRALQQSALKQWAKNIHDKKATQSVFSHRAYMNSLAATGNWEQDKELLS